jgi:hypothetical protein
MKCDSNGTNFCVQCAEAVSGRSWLKLQQQYFHDQLGSLLLAAKMNRNTYYFVTAYYRNKCLYLPLLLTCCTTASMKNIKIQYIDILESPEGTDSDVNF